MNNRNIIVFDFETGGLNPLYHPPIQIAAIVINPRTLDMMPNAVFNKMMCPPADEFDRIEDQALKVNKKTREEIKDAPPEKLVWADFAEFCLRYKSDWRPCIPCGKNIGTFDMIIARKLCKKYNYWDKKKDQQSLLDEREQLELERYLFAWFENSNELIDFKLDTLRTYFGISAENAHDALQDVKDTWEILKKFLLLHRKIAKKTTFKG